MIKSHLLENTEILKKCLIFYNCIGGDANIIDFNIDKFDAMSKRDFDRMLKPMLSKDENFDYKKTIGEIQQFLKKLLCFTDEDDSLSKNSKIKNTSQKNYSMTKMLFHVFVGILWQFGDVIVNS